MAQLSIKWHATRGKEVIEILEILGGKNGRIHANEWFTNELTPYKEQETWKERN